jgi:hypothetical protein
MGEMKKTNPKLWLSIPCYEYHLYSSEARGLNIYMYRRREYTKHPLEKYNN